MPSSYRELNLLPTLAASPKLRIPLLDNTHFFPFAYYMPEREDKSIKTQINLKYNPYCPTLSLLASPQTAKIYRNPQEVCKPLFEIVLSLSTNK